MTTLRTCPRCGQAARPPSPADAAWTCPEHGAVTPVVPAQQATPELLTRLGEHAQVPIWLPAPLPVGWGVSGVVWAGDEPSGAVATVLAVTGPHLIPEAADGDPSADLLLVAEQPGIGLGARLAGLSGVDAGPLLKEKVEHERAEAHVIAGGHEVPVWSVGIGSPPIGDGAPRLGISQIGGEGIGFVGEAAGVWLWLLAWPATTAALLLEGFQLLDARDPQELFDVPMGPLTARLR